MIGLQSERLYLAPIKEESLDKMYLWKNDLFLLERLMAQPFFSAQETVKQWLQRNSTDPNQVFLGIYLKENDELIGVSRLMFIDWLHRTTEIGAYIGPEEHRGKGYGREMFTLIFNYAFEHLNLHKIIFRMLDSDNVYKKLYQDLGAEHEGVQRQQFWLNGRYEDMCLMGLINKKHR